jgi:hypothetical protein
VGELAPRYKVGDRVRCGRDYQHLATVRRVKRWPRTTWYVLEYDHQALREAYSSDTYPESQLVPA